MSIVYARIWSNCTKCTGVGLKVNTSKWVVKVHGGMGGNVPLTGLVALLKTQPVHIKAE